MTTELRLRELVAAEVRFVIVGGLAVNARGHVRGTQDVDLVPDPHRGNLDRLASVLEEAGGRVETEQGRFAASAISTFLAGDRTLIATDLGPVDVLQGLPQVPPFWQLNSEAVAVISAARSSASARSRHCLLRSARPADYGIVTTSKLSRLLTA